MSYCDQEISSELYKQYGFSAKSTERISQGVMNENWIIETNENHYILRISRRKAEPETAMERHMLQQLASDSFPCPHPIQTIDQQIGFTFQERPAILYLRLPGSTPTDHTPNLLEQVGSLLGRIHARFQDQPDTFQKPRWDPTDILQLIPQWREPFHIARYPDSETFLNWIETELRACQFPDDLPRGFTHQDLKPENTLAHNSSITGVLDFDNCYHGTLLHDLTTSLIWWCFDATQLVPERVQAFIRGYESIRPLTLAERALLLSDGLRFRLLREIFIGPMTTLSDLPLATSRAAHFEQCYRNTFNK